MPWTIEFFEDDGGHQPCREWIRRLDGRKQAAVIAAIETYLATLGIDICRTEHGKQLGDGLFELRIRHDEVEIRGADSVANRAPAPKGGEILLRVFCHAYGQKIVLLVGGYDKGVSPGTRRQQKEIEVAKKRLRAFRLRQQRTRAGDRRRKGLP